MTCVFEVLARDEPVFFFFFFPHSVLPPFPLDICDNPPAPERVGVSDIWSPGPNYGNHRLTFPVYVPFLEAVGLLLF